MKKILDSMLGLLLRKTDEYYRILTKKRCEWFGHDWKPLQFSSGLSKDTLNCKKCGKLKLWKNS